jgi:hypothetical protein
LRRPLPTQQLLRIPQMLFRYVALVATAFASGADAQALPPSQLLPFVACVSDSGVVATQCASKKASCGSKLNPLAISDAAKFASIAAAQATCAEDLAPYIPSTARRRLADADFCPTECQEFEDCAYDAVIPCIKKIDGIPSGLVDVVKTTYACQAKAQTCVFALVVTVVPH